MLKLLTFYGSYAIWIYTIWFE